MKDIDLTNDNILSVKNDSNIDILNEIYDIKQLQQLPLVFKKQINISNILIRDDVTDLFSSLKVIGSNYSSIEIDSLLQEADGYFCDSCFINLFNSSRRCECGDCFNKRMLENNMLHLLR